MRNRAAMKAAVAGSAVAEAAVGQTLRKGARALC